VPLILIADHRGGIAHSLVDLLQRLGCSASLSEDGRDLAERALVERPSAILISLSVDGDALALCATVRVTKGLERVPLVLVSRSKDPALEQRVRALKIATTVLYAPVLRSGLARCLEQIGVIDEASVATTSRGADALGRESADEVESIDSVEIVHVRPQRPPPRASSTMAKVSDGSAEQQPAARVAGEARPRRPPTSSTLTSFRAVTPLPSSAKAPVETPPLAKSPSAAAQAPDAVPRLVEALLAVRADLARVRGLPPPEPPANPATFTDPAELHQLHNELQRHVEGLRAAREVVTKRLMEVQTRLALVETKCSTLEHDVRAREEAHEKSLEWQRDEFSQRLAEVEEAHRESKWLLAETRAQLDVAIDRAQSAERARSSLQQELVRSEHARDEEIARAGALRAEVEGARRAAQQAHEAGVRASEEAHTHKLRRLEGEQRVRELEQEAREIERVVEALRAAEQQAERRANGQADTIAALERQLAEALEALRVTRDELRSVERVVEPVPAAFDAGTEQKLRAELEAALAERARLVSDSARELEERLATQARQLADQYAEAKRQSDANWMAELHGRVLAAITLLENDRAEALGAQRAAHNTALARAEAAWSAIRSDLEREIRALALNDATTSDALDDALERIKAVEGMLAEKTAAHDQALAEQQRLLDELAAARRAYAEARTDWSRARRVLGQQIETMQSTLSQILLSEPPPAPKGPASQG
jgi:hypothetical protein